MRTHITPVAASISIVGGVAAVLLGDPGPLPTAIAWLVAGAALALALHPARPAPDAGMDGLERELMRCRRRGERGWVLAARAESPAGSPPDRLLACFRVTDSVALLRTRGSFEVAGVFPDGLAREGLERRMQASIGGRDLSFGWARFPEDGATLQVLLESARAALTGSDDVASRWSPDAAASVSGVRILGSGAE